MKLYMPLYLLESSKTDFYRELAFKYLFLGKRGVPYGKDEGTMVEFNDVYNHLFPRLYADKIRMEELICYIETSDSMLDEQVPSTFPNEQNISVFRDYLLSYIKRGNKLLLMVGHKEIDNYQQNLPSNNEMRCFVDYFKNTDMSNIYTEKKYIDQVRSKYATPTEESLNNSTVAEIKEYMTYFGMNDLMSANDEYENFSEANKAELIRFIIETQT